MNAQALFNQLELKILDQIPTQNEEAAVNSRDLSAHLSLPREIVSAVLRNLRNKGFTVYTQCVDPDEWTPSGSGYYRTQEGTNYALGKVSHAG